MNVILFDLGDTLEHNGALLPGAPQMLTDAKAMTDPAGLPVAIGLLSDFGKPATLAESNQKRAEYIGIITTLGISPFFQPFNSQITLSSDSLDPDFKKPSAAIFRAALDKIEPALAFSKALFITENLTHIQAARTLGLATIHFKSPGAAAGDVDNLPGLVPVIRTWLASQP